MGLAKGSPNSTAVQTLLGDFYWAKKDVTRARSAYERASTLEGGSVDALAGLVRVDLLTKKPTDARARLDAQLAKTPDDEELLLLAGTTFLTIGESQRAESAFRHVLEVNPSNFQAYGMLGSFYLRSGHLDEAKKEFEEMARKQPNSAAAATTMVGTILTLQGKTDEARAQYEHALSIDPQIPVAANNLAWDYAETGRNLDEALKLAQKAKAILPDNADVTDTLGWIYYKKGLADLAVTTLEEAVKQVPSNPSIHYRLGLAYVKNGDQKKARAAFEQALKFGPQFKEAEDAQRQLAALKG
jgi:Flp pilus assembly protein TadD